MNLINFNYKFLSGKNSKFLYYLRNFLCGLIPDRFFRWRYRQLMKTWQEREDCELILDRVNYYCKLDSKTSLPEDAPRLAEFHRKGHRSVYYFDSYEYVRCFPPFLRWCYLFGDVRDVPVVPAIVKSRPVKGENANSVLLNMDKVRHFVFLRDRIPYPRKKNKIIFRGDVHGKPWRIHFMETWFGDEACDLGDVGRRAVNPVWCVKKMTLYEHLRYKFILAIEGNDVASNLKWIMSSNSLPVMPRPTFETWFMEGRLIPGFHYVEIKPDFSDLREQMRYYLDNPDKAEEIITHAHDWVNQFRDKKRERIISLLVLQKYFYFTGQS